MLVEFFRQGLIDMRSDQRAESIGNLLVLALAADGAILWKKSFFDNVAKELRIGSVSHTQEIEKALHRGAVLVGETLPRHRNRRRRQVSFVLIGATQDEPSRFSLLNLNKMYVENWSAASSSRPVNGICHMLKMAWPVS